VCLHSPHPLSFPTRRSSDLLPRFEALVLEVGEDPGIVGIADRIDGGNAGMAMVDMVEAPLHLEVEGRDDNCVWSELADLPGNRSDRKSTRLNSSHVKISYAV